MCPYLQKQRVKICEIHVGQKWELKYRAFRDGFKQVIFIRIETASPILSLLLKQRVAILSGVLPSKNGIREVNGLQTPKLLYSVRPTRKRNPLKLCVRMKANKHYDANQSEDHFLEEKVITLETFVYNQIQI
jgi:hypothetical protein